MSLTSTSEVAQSIRNLALFVLMSVLPWSAWAEEEEVPYFERLEASVTYWWSTSYLGDIDDGLFTIRLVDELGLDDDQGEWAFRFEAQHNFNYLPPNIRFTYHNIAQKNGQSNGRFITFDGNDSDSTNGGGPFRGSVNSEFDLTYYDTLFYYNWIPTFFQVDLGMSLRVFDGYYLLEETFSPELIFSDAVFDQQLIMVFIGAKVEVPKSGWAYEAEIFASTFDSFNVNEYSLNLLYDFGRIEGELGYHSMRLKANDVSDLAFDVRIDGIFFTFRYELL